MVAKRRLPAEVIKAIDARKVSWTSKAFKSSVALGLEWDDVIAIAMSSFDWKREEDEEKRACDGYKDSCKGRDTHGRLMYLAGKKVYFNYEVRWHVITIHEAKR